MTKKEQNSQIHTERIEDKVIISRTYLAEFKRSLDKLMDTGYPEPDTTYVINKSVYFDSPELVCLKQHLDRDDHRHKIRIRSYAPNGKPSKIAFLEVKYKDGKETKKDRIQIGPDHKKSLMEKSILPIDDELLILNQDVLGDKQTTEKANVVNGLLAVSDSKPVVEITYHRLAFKNGENFRITLDQDIEVKPLKGLNTDELYEKKTQNKLEKFEVKYINSEDFLLEVKYTNKSDIPVWLTRKMDKLLLEPVKFSKYAYSMSIIESKELKVK